MLWPIKITRHALKTSLSSSSHQAGHRLNDRRPNFNHFSPLFGQLHAESLHKVIVPRQKGTCNALYA